MKIVAGRTGHAGQADRPCRQGRTDWSRKAEQARTGRYGRQTSQAGIGSAGRQDLSRRACMLSWPCKQGREARPFEQAYQPGW